MKNNQNLNQSPSHLASQSTLQSYQKTPTVRPWIISTVIILGFFVVTLLLPENQIEDFATGVVAISVLIVFFEGKRIEIQKYPATLFGRGPWSYAFTTFLLWVVALPFFINRRYKILNGEIQMKGKAIKI